MLSGLKWAVIGPCLFLGTWACGDPPEPVLPVVSEEAETETEAVGKGGAPAFDARGRPIEVEPVLEPRVDRFVDVRWLGGRRFSVHRGQIATMLGDLQSREIVGDRDGEAFTFEKATIYVVRDVVYRVDLSLPDALPPNDALVALGFPRNDRSFRKTHREFRASFKWGFARFRLMRATRNGPTVDTVQIWHTEPVKAGR